jgi:hypothetical protein
MAVLWHHPSPRSQDLSSLQSKRGRRKRLGANAGALQPWAPKRQPGHNKARGGDPGLCLLERAGCLWLWGRSCRRWHLGPGDYRDVLLGPGHLMGWEWGGAVDGDRADFVKLISRNRFQKTTVMRQNVRDPLRVLEQGPDRQRAPCQCSGGLSSIRGASESDAHTIGRLAVAGNRQRQSGHRSSWEAMGVHEGAFTDAVAQPGRDRSG